MSQVLGAARCPVSRRVARAQEELPGRQLPRSVLLPGWGRTGGA